jgi:hypothetical protein
MGVASGFLVADGGDQARLARSMYSKTARLGPRIVLEWGK